MKTAGKISSSLKHDDLQQNLQCIKKTMVSDKIFLYVVFISYAELFCSKKERAA